MGSLLHKLSDLRDRDVINISDGRRLGFIADVDVDPASGHVRSLICPGGGRFLGFFGGGKDHVIRWDQVIKIGPDVILVDLGYTAGSPGQGVGGPGQAGGPF